MKKKKKHFPTKRAHEKREPKWGRTNGRQVSHGTGV